MNKYKVLVSRNYATEIEVIAENEEDAERKADDIFDALELRGHELYDDYNGSIELLEEDVEEDDEE